MLSKASFEACPYCGCHVSRGSTACPHCDRALQRTRGRLPPALVAVMMGLGAGAASSAACSSVPRDEGAGGDGAGGEDGYGPSTSYTAAMSSYGVPPTSSPATTGAGSSECDEEADCEACQTCSFDSVCTTQAAECAAEPECLSLNDCANACPARDDACVQACVDANPSGVDPLVALIDCVYCDACLVTCDGAAAAC